MMENFLSVLKETAVFMLAAQMILHFLPGDKYTKYGKMIAATVIFSRLVLPVLSFGNLDFAAEFSERVQLYETENRVFTHELENMALQQESLWLQEMMGSVETQLEEVALQNGLRISSVDMEGEVMVIQVQREFGAGDGAGDGAGEKVPGSGENAKISQDSSASVLVEPVTVDPVKIGADRAVNAGENILRGRPRSDLEEIFAKKLGMQAELVEVIEVG